MDFLSNSLSIDEMDNVRWRMLFVAGSFHSLHIPVEFKILA